MKHQIPLAAVLLAAGCNAASAQTTVTAYGTIDAVAGRFKGAATGVNSLAEPLYRLDGGGMSTSHIGFRGTEDLGSGLKAVFDIAAFMRNDTGAAGRNDAIGPPANVGADPFWSRNSWVGLSDATWGRVRAGNITTQLFISAIGLNAFGDSTVFGPLNLVTFIGGPQAGGTSWANQLVYDSPSFGAFSFNVARTLSEGPSGANSALRLSYAQGPLSASFAWQGVKKDPATFAEGTTANNVKTWLLGGSYDAGPVKLFAHAGRIQNDGTEAAPADVGYRLWDLSASVPVGEGRLLGGYALRKTSDTPAPVPAGAPGGNVKRAVLTLGYDHYLSKRTDLYAMVMSDKTETRTVGAPPSIVSASGTSYGVGIRHRY